MFKQFLTNIFISTIFPLSKPRENTYIGHIVTFENPLFILKFISIDSNVEWKYLWGNSTFQNLKICKLNNLSGLEWFWKWNLSLQFALLRCHTFLLEWLFLFCQYMNDIWVVKWLRKIYDEPEKLHWNKNRLINDNKNHFGEKLMRKTLTLNLKHFFACNIRNIIEFIVIYLQYNNNVVY